ncbi:MAG: V-type ATPase 116kDa subunit family protein, partial [Candidatus Lokiarchaeota archaeon]
MEKENEAFIKTEDKKSEKSEKGKGQEEEDVSSENEEEKLQAQTPTRMRHNFIIRPFETLTRMYGIPSYAEIDPTPILFITFPLLFGIMFGDIGHGLILIIAGLVGGIIFRKRKTGDIKNMSWIIFYCGWAAMIFGFLYGEFFGQQQILGYQLNPIPIPIPFFGALILYHPLENVMVLFIIAVILGVLHLNLGWILQFINYFMQNKRYLALTETIPKMFFLDSGFYVIFRYSVDFNAWFAAPYPVLLPIIAGLLLIVFKIVGKALGISYIQQQTYGQLLAEGSIETFETVLSIPGNVFSYIRLLALALAHISLMLAIRAMAGLIVGNNFVTQFIIIVSLI